MGGINRNPRSSSTLGTRVAWHAINWHDNRMCERSSGTSVLSRRFKFYSPPPPWWWNLNLTRAVSSNWRQRPQIRQRTRMSDPPKNGDANTHNLALCWMDIGMYASVNTSNTLTQSMRFSLRQQVVDIRDFHANFLLLKSSPKFARVHFNFSIQPIQTDLFFKLSVSFMVHLVYFTLMVEHFSIALQVWSI